ncbi:16S rRNA (cytosine(1402)-N(4))-methyltransferase RsmH [Pseudohalioglobus lutimaris]|uniref:Ribosomal RNA small subunit methyltransferase H n=1 Tax=Pseudohalioglobus lutimaris TaxID=1737061 RepID=A0A2N5X7Q9_9GAMM|nr:16S rRNA (cytosine(1402)-N(4))-methyltransferase RsmH [Pseudohalioglobus lutimaris]PLW70512.1 16S rRNA (cytosine(1402)-N(4))-methyltransferase [Pseudohalioglobus lutimaris]
MHQTVLLREAVNALVTAPSGLYVDGTFGRGGHSRLLLQALDDKGRLLAVDKDPAACEVAETMADEDPRFSFYHGSFADLPARLRAMGVSAVDGILLDLGVSSPQLDEAQRGFSFMHDGPLDMRMDTTSGETAAQWLAYADAADIAAVLKDYGEERFAKRIANAIVDARDEAPLTTTGRLAKVVSEANPRWEKHKHPATRAFQAIRIKVNRELDDLQDLLKASVDLLKVGGRLVVISFHSLEDRMVKRYMRDMARGEQLPPGVPVLDAALNRRLKLVGKAIKASPEEVGENARARSAVMRVAEKIA